MPHYNWRQDFASAVFGARRWHTEKTDGHFVGIVLWRRPQSEPRFDAVEHDRRRRPKTFVATFDIDRPPTCSCLYFATYVREKSTLDPWWLAVCLHDNESHPVDPTTRWPPLVAAVLPADLTPPNCAVGFPGFSNHCWPELTANRNRRRKMRKPWRLERFITQEFQVAQLSPYGRLAVWPHDALKVVYTGFMRRVAAAPY